MSPHICVVMPSYNHAAFVGVAIQSILDQSFQDFEIIVTDDGSGDGTPDVVRKFLDPRIKLEVFPENRGGVVAGNSAIRRSSGKYIARLNSDDFFLPGKLEKQVAFLEANPDIAAVFGMPRLIDERGKPLAEGYREFTFPFSHPRPSREEWLRRFFIYGNCLCFPTVMIRRSVLDEVGLLDPRLANLPDFDLWVRLCMEHDIYVMQAELTAFRKLDNNRNMSAPRVDTVLRATFEYFQILKHYRRLDPEFAFKIFANDLAEWGINTNRRFGIWLGELALHAASSPHRLFALETMFETSATAEDECRRLIEWTGKVDVFKLIEAGQLRELQQKFYDRQRTAMDEPGNPATGDKVRRNSQCPCGSGKKYKYCHGRLP
jgi:glycosyltransferase involved in cell wall biosynthesis